MFKKGLGLPFKLNDLGLKIHLRKSCFGIVVLLKFEDADVGKQKTHGFCKHIHLTVSQKASFEKQLKSPITQ